MYIPSEKWSKSDIYKTCNIIFIRYIDITKHLKVWAIKTYQVLIASNPIINKSKQGADLLVENPMPLLSKTLQKLANKPKPQGSSRKRSHIKNKGEYNSSVNIEGLDKGKMRIEMIKIDLDRILSKTLLRKGK